ncbi:sialate O-acetylesterase [Sphingopyxis sp. P1IMeth2]|uniref:sialate O-acetylesterase n=1 Tax=Sphingopyxis sp. P1IMeth2 TaxID=1892848 RepID=UPI001647025B|nr:sialate O-acetylesterase [Sphingopyxis sp. P1IMeth2]
MAKALFGPLMSQFETNPAPRRTFLLLFGQSNAIAYGCTTAALTADRADIPPDILTIPGDKVQLGYSDGRAFHQVPYHPSHSNLPDGPSAWGPEGGFAASWASANPHAESRLLIMKRQQDASNLGQWIAQSAQRAWLQSYAREGLARGPWDDVVAFMVNGESEGVSETLADACYARLTLLCADLRAALGPTAHILISRLPNSWKSYPFLKRVREAQAAVAATHPLIHLIDTDRLPYRDQYHFRASAIADLGRTAFSVIR